MKLNALLSPRALLVSLLVAVLLTVVVAGATSTAAFGASNAAWDGSSALQSTADAAGTDSRLLLETNAYRNVTREGTVAVVLSPTQPYDETDGEAMRAFVREGGTLVVGSDFGSRGNALLAAVGADARFDGSLLRDDRHYYRTPAMVEATNVSDHPLVAGSDTLTLNHGTAVEPRSGNATVLVRTSEYGYLDRNGNDALDESEQLDAYPVVAVERVGSGRVVVVGDPSVFINAMLDRQGNQQFTRALFGQHQRVLLDYSHAPAQPPLVSAVLLVRRSTWLQVLVGLIGLGAIGAWRRNPDVVRSLRDRLRGEHRPVEVGTDEAELRAYLRERHPDWDESRLNSVIAGVINSRNQVNDDE